MSRNPPAGGLLVLIDRCTREYFIERLDSLSQEAVARALKRMRRRAVLARAVRTRAAAPSPTTQHRKGHINETVRITPKVPQKNFLAGVSFRLQFTIVKSEEDDNVPAAGHFMRPSPVVPETRMARPARWFRHSLPDNKAKPPLRLGEPDLSASRT